VRKPLPAVGLGEGLGGITEPLMGFQPKISSAAPSATRTPLQRLLPVAGWGILADAVRQFHRGGRCGADRGRGCARGPACGIVRGLGSSLYRSNTQCRQTFHGPDFIRRLTRAAGRRMSSRRRTRTTTPSCGSCGSTGANSSAPDRSRRRSPPSNTGRRGRSGRCTTRRGRSSAAALRGRVGRSGAVVAPGIFRGAARRAAGRHGSAGAGPGDDARRSIMTACRRQRAPLSLGA
jgi:hypothetical protein